MKALKFFAEWCGPCKMMSNVIKNAGDKIPMPVEDIDIDANNDMAIKYNIRSVPTMVIVDEHGFEMKRKVGAMNESQLLEFLKG